MYTVVLFLGLLLWRCRLHLRFWFSFRLSLAYGLHFGFVTSIRFWYAFSFHLGADIGVSKAGVDILLGILLRCRLLWSYVECLFLVLFRSILLCRYSYRVFLLHLFCIVFCICRYGYGIILLSLFRRVYAYLHICVVVNYSAVYQLILILLLFLRLLLVFDGCRFCQQLYCADSERNEVLLVELVVVVVAIPRSEQFLVGVAYYYGAAFTGQTQNVLV